MSFRPFQPFRGFGGGAAPFNPLLLSPSVWFSDTGSDPGVWPDLSGNGRHAGQATPSKRPAIIAGGRNGRQVRRFDGNNDTLQTASFELPAFSTMFVVQSCVPKHGAKFWFEHGPNTNTVQGQFFQGMDGTTWTINRGGLHAGYAGLSSNWSGDEWAVASFVYNGQGFIYKNGSLVSSASSVGNARLNTLTPQPMNIGSRNQSTLYMQGDLAEILIVPAVLFSADRQNVERYLGNKWGISVA